MLHGSGTVKPLIPILLARLGAVEETGGGAGVACKSLHSCFIRNLFAITENTAICGLSATVGRRLRKQPHHLVAAVVDQVGGPAAL